MTIIPYEFLQNLAETFNDPANVAYIKNVAFKGVGLAGLMLAAVGCLKLKSFDSDGDTSKTSDQNNAVEISRRNIHMQP